MSSTIESVLNESRVFPPPADFVRQANIAGMDAYLAMCAEAERDFEGFWARHARAERPRPAPRARGALPAEMRGVS